MIKTILMAAAIAFGSTVAFAAPPHINGSHSDGGGSCGCKSTPGNSGSRPASAGPGGGHGGSANSGGPGGHSR